ncbi:MAG: tpiA [Bacilli bacterium]|nr:tpiA [Bacilli bacterium]
MTRTPILAGNWKMFKTRAEAADFVGRVKQEMFAVSGVEIVVCAPFTALDQIAAELTGTVIGVGAQNMHDADEGAYTGEVAPRMLTELGVRYVILGHSERRAYFAETDEAVNRKVHSALQHQLIPIVCVGENLEQRDKGQTFQVVEGQTQAAFQGVSAENAVRVVLAYEPIWAIGTGKTATSEDANLVCGQIRQTIAKLYNEETAQAVRIQYGGSVKPDNIASFTAEEQIDGALVGGASLDPASFVKLVQGAAEGASRKS